MIALAQFLGVVFSGVSLVALAISVGGVVFAAFVLTPADAAARRRSMHVTAVAAVLAAVARMAALFLIPLAFEESDRSAVSELFATTYAHATLAQATALMVLATAAWRFGSAFIGVHRRLILLFAATLALTAGAWLTHAASRVEDAAILMTVTVLHQLGAAIWLGGIAHLAVARPLACGAGDLWPRLLARFSPLALAAVVLLAATGIYLAWRYVADWSALIGTGYGAMVMAKIALFATALALGFLNYRAVRSWRRGRPESVETSVPSYVQGELAIVITAVLTAASLTSQAPAVDVHADHASAGEVAAFFAPKKPLIVPPPREALLAVSASTQDAFAVPGTLERAQNNFNHNISGLLVLAVAIAALLDRFRVRAARHWPLLFLPLAAFVFVFAEPTVWPWGPEPFWATLQVPAVLQHRLAALLVVGLAIGEWRVRVGALRATHWRFVFPVLCAVGGAMLLTHSHTVFATKSEFLIELSHAVLGFLAVMVGVGRWLELRLPHRGSHAAGVAWSMCLIGVAWVLIFYREA